MKLVCNIFSVERHQLVFLGICPIPNMGQAWDPSPQGQQFRCPHAVLVLVAF